MQALRVIRQGHETLMCRVGHAHPMTRGAGSGSVFKEGARADASWQHAAAAAADGSSLCFRVDVVRCLGTLVLLYYKLVNTLPLARCKLPKRTWSFPFFFFTMVTLLATVQASHSSLT